jgi:uncharacterized protein
VEPVLSAVRHREETLVALAEAAVAKGDKDIFGAQVAVIGLADPKSYDEPPVPAVAAQRAGALPIHPVAHQPDNAPPLPKDKAQAYALDQERLFAQTFAGLFENRGFRTNNGAKTRLDFLDADDLKDSDGAPLNGEALAEKLRGYDCVVVARELPTVTLAAARQHHAQVIDARDFRFDPFNGEATAARRGDHVQAIYTGVVPVVYKAQRTLLESLVTSTQYAFVSIALCLMVLMRRGPLRPWNFLNPRAGLIAMVPNIFPLAIVFGMIGWIGIDVDIGSMMTASIAIGVSVDDTIHYLNFFRKSMLKGKTRREAIVASYKHCGSAIVETVLIGGFGLSVFAFSTFTPTQRFGTMMMTMLLVGAAGELLWLPALLTGPLGRFFEPLKSEIAAAQLALEGAGGEPPAGSESSPSPRPPIEPPHASRPAFVRRDQAH